MKINQLKVQSPDFIPEEIQEGILYVSMAYSTASHKCACGCGQEVVTPFSPTDWKLTYDGEGISLFPSIGNWSYPCRSHYFIRNNKIVWAKGMSAEDIELGRLQDRDRKEKHYHSEHGTDGIRSAELKSSVSQTPKPNVLLRAIRRFFGLK